MKTNKLQGLLKIYGNASDKMLERETRIVFKKLILQKAKRVVDNTKVDKDLQIAFDILCHERRRRAEHLGL